MTKPDEDGSIGGALPRRVPSMRPGPIGGKRDRNRRQRTEALCRAGLELFLSRGVENVTVDEIARAAGTAKGNFYRYLKDKEDLVAALLAPLEAAFEVAFDEGERKLEAAESIGPMMSAYNDLARALTQILQQHRDVVLLYLQEARGPAVGPRRPLSRFAERLTARTIALTEVAHTHGLLRQIPAKLSALAVIGAAERLLLAHLTEGAFDDDLHVATGLVALVMRGLLA